MSEAEAGKRAAAAAAVALVEPDMVLGLGSGTTMRLALEALGQRVREQHLRVVGIPTSMQTEALALTLGITLADPGTPIDLALDGADEIERGTLRLIKGLGGALLREKIVVQSARRFVVVADASKLVRRLGERASLPVEVERFGHLATARRLAALGGKPVPRLDAAGEPMETDGGHLIYDCAGFAPIGDPFTLERDLYAIAGVIETGLFVECVERALVGAADGTVAVFQRT
jgi:ribose 5-phosphate isomerase A